jgi:hypothetical protein
MFKYLTITLCISVSPLAFTANAMQKEQPIIEIEKKKKNPTPKQLATLYADKLKIETIQQASGDSEQDRLAQRLKLIQNFIKDALESEVFSTFNQKAKLTFIQELIQQITQKLNQHAWVKTTSWAQTGSSWLSYCGMGGCERFPEGKIIYAFLLEMLKQLKVDLKFASDFKIQSAFGIEIYTVSSGFIPFQTYSQKSSEKQAQLLYKNIEQIINTEHQNLMKQINTSLTTQKPKIVTLKGSTTKIFAAQQLGQFKSLSLNEDKIIQLVYWGTTLINQMKKSQTFDTQLLKYASENLDFLNEPLQITKNDDKGKFLKTIIAITWALAKDAFKKQSKFYTDGAFMIKNAPAFADLLTKYLITELGTDYKKLNYFYGTSFAYRREALGFQFSSHLKHIQNPEQFGIDIRNFSNKEVVALLPSGMQTILFSIISPKLLFFKPEPNPMGTLIEAGHHTFDFSVQKESSKYSEKVIPAEITTIFSQIIKEATNYYKIAFNKSLIEELLKQEQDIQSYGKILGTLITGEKVKITGYTLPFWMMYRVVALIHNQFSKLEIPKIESKETLTTTKSKESEFEVISGGSEKELIPQIINNSQRFIMIAQKMKFLDYPNERLGSEIIIDFPKVDQPQ